jgi:Flp pilus assembly protein TadG
LRTSEKGSAVVEFLLLVIPMLFLISSTFGVSWYAYVKTQARVIAAKSAFHLSQPDSDSNEVSIRALSDFSSQLGMANVRVAAEVFGSLSEIRITSSAHAFSGFPGLTFPELAVTSHEFMEFER